MAKKNHTVRIIELASGSHAVVDPGTLWVDCGDTITFHNDTAFQASMLVAEGGVLGGVRSMQGLSLKKGGPRAFTVLASRPGVYEYVVAVKLQQGRRVFAVGSSTPRVIVRSSSDVG